MAKERVCARLKGAKKLSGKFILVAENMPGGRLIWEDYDEKKKTPSANSRFFEVKACLVQSTSSKDKGEVVVDLGEEKQAEELVAPAAVE